MDGTGQITIDAGGPLDAELAEITVDMRIKIASYPASEAVLFERGTTSGTDHAKLYLDSSGYLNFQIEGQDDSGTATSNGALPTGTWLHVAGKYESGHDKVTVNINGIYSVNETVSAGVLTKTTAAPKIGTGLSGKIDEVHVRNLATSSFNQTGEYAPDTTTLALWHFNTGSGTQDSVSVNTRYLRMKATSWSTICSVAELRAINSAGTNLSLNGTLTASSNVSGYPASNAKDNNTGTLWASAQGGASPQWLQADLGSSQTLQRVEVQWRTDGAQIPTYWSLETADSDSGPWTAVATYPNDSIASPYLQRSICTPVPLGAAGCPGRTITAKLVSEVTNASILTTRLATAMRVSSDE